MENLSFPAGIIQPGQMSQEIVRTLLNASFPEYRTKIESVDFLVPYKTETRLNLVLKSHFGTVSIYS